MLKKERQNYILDRVAREGRITTNELVAELGLAQDTIRKDFQELSARGLVQRVHGGVLRLEGQQTPKYGFPGTPDLQDAPVDRTGARSADAAPAGQDGEKPESRPHVDFYERITQYPEVKKRLAERAALLVGDMHVLYIDGSTTNLWFAEALPEDFTGTVITNSPAVALALCKYPGVEINMVGGSLHKVDRVVQGSRAIEQLQNLNLECSVLGISSLSAQQGITYPSSGEAIYKREIMNHSRMVIAIANREKLATSATFFSREISAVDILVTNETREEILAPFREAGVQIIIEEING